jgi:hypothetical protein
MKGVTFVAWLGMFLLLPALLLGQTQATTIRGKVSQVSHPGGTGTHVWLENNGKTQEVCLGDSRFLEENGFAPKFGDAIEVTGSYDGQVFVADSLSAGGRTLNLQGVDTGSGAHPGGHHCWGYRDGNHHGWGHGNHAGHCCCC